MHLAHSLKGSAGNIGAGELREAADELETKLQRTSAGCNHRKSAAANCSRNWPDC